jgi:hypothetical protein
MSGLSNHYPIKNRTRYQLWAQISRISLENYRDRLRSSQALSSRSEPGEVGGLRGKCETSPADLPVRISALCESTAAHHPIAKSRPNPCTEYDLESGKPGMLINTIVKKIKI